MHFFFGTVSINYEFDVAHICMDMYQEIVRYRLMIFLLRLFLTNLILSSRIGQTISKFLQCG